MEEIGWRISADQEIASREIEGVRKDIDDLDARISELLQERLGLARKIGAVKATSGIPVKDGSREQTVIENVLSQVRDEKLKSSIAKVYEMILAESRGLQANSSETEPETVPEIQYFPQVAIIGVGAIGGAMAKRIKQVIPSTTIVGCDRPEVLQQAEALGLINSGEVDAKIAIKKASLILLCADPKQNLQLLEELAPHTKRRQVIVDVTSTKRAICDLAERLPLKADFVGGHPLFGTHKSGVENSSSIEIVNSRFCLTPTTKSTELTLRRLTRWLSDLGLRVLREDATGHDRTVARTSHLVQLMAVALGNVIADSTIDGATSGNGTALSGNALRGLSRLMSSPSGLWINIIDQNKDEIQAAITELVTELNSLERNIASGDRTAIESAFEQAAVVSQSLDKN